MIIRFSKRDFEIANGVTELYKIVESDIKSAFAEVGGLRILSQRTTDLYDSIIEAVEAQARAYEDRYS